MARDEQTLAILVADVCGRTPLIENSGNIEALDLIADCLDNISRIVEAEGGTVLRCKGDDVLCTFRVADSPVRAAARAVDGQAGGPLEIRVGIDYGPIVHTRRGICGDALNTAARMRALAKPGEIITTEAVYDRLSRDLSRKVRRLDGESATGKSPHMNIYAVFKDDSEVAYHGGEDPEHTLHPENVSEASGPKAAVTLEFGARTIVRRDAGPGIHIGRADSCDLVIDEPCVSRDHALLTIRRGKVMLADMSSTGTWVAQADDDPVLLRRNVMQLAGDGLISLGLHPKEGGPARIIYRLGEEESHDD